MHLLHYSRAVPDFRRQDRQLCRYNRSVQKFPSKEHLLDRTCHELPKYSASSHFLLFLKTIAEYPTSDAAIPIISAAMGPTNPDAGVIATKPATAPVAAPMVEALPVCAQEMSIQVKAAVPVAICVAIKALVADELAAVAEPALNPNQPNHSNAAPNTIRGTLCASIGTFPYPSRRPSIIAAIKPAQPDVMWITVPPAKSSDGSAPVQPTAVPPAPRDQVQCAAKSYTKVAHITTNTT